MNWIHRLNASIKQQSQQARLPLRIGQAKRVRDSWRDQQPATRSGSPTCLLDLSHVAADGEQGRRFHTLVTLLHRSGYDLWLTPRLSFLQSGHKPFKGWAIQTTRVHDPASGPEQFDVCLSDRTSNHPLADRTLRLRTSLRRPLGENEIHLPYGCYPFVWQNREDERFETYRKRPRSWRVFFGGYFQKEAYEKIKRYTKRPVIDRHTVIHALIAAYGDRLTRIEDDNALETLKTTPTDDFVLIDSSRYRLPANDWLDVLSRTDFFVAAPGGDYPLCHNCVEALAVGSIPILQYGSLFHPTLQDGVNCLAYETLDELPRLIQRIDQMSAEEIDSLRGGAIDYFENHLSPRAFRQQIERPDADGVHVFPYLVRAA